MPESISSLLAVVDVVNVVFSQSVMIRSFLL